MTDTEIKYSYKDTLHDDTKIGFLTLDKQVFKKYLGRYDTEYNDPLSKIERRLWNMGLVASRSNVINFLDMLMSFLKESGYDSEDDDYCKIERLRDFLKLQKEDSLEIKFQCY